ncbi:MAG: peptide deformylase [Alphaproteobacteria bacterium]|nr:peptide deformylase [Alphaproteobacteria bacterium]
MACLPILTWPDERLTQTCPLVTEITDDIRQLASDMLETMYAAPGRGLAAPQVGVIKRVFVMDTDWKDGPRNPITMINPVIEWASDETTIAPEGCLSIPGIQIEVKRAAEIRMRWIDETGEKHRETLTGFAAICAQHELDHLDGLITLDHVGPAERAALEARYAEARA